MSDAALPPRVLSIDVLRGFDMLMIVFLDRFVWELHGGLQTPFTAALATQFDHPEWFGSTFYDIIMPLFLFVVGAVIPFSLSERMQARTPRAAIYAKLVRRFVILFVLGWVVQGNLLAWDVAEFHVFSNTLQAIAVGYVCSCLAWLHLSRRGRYGLFAGLLLVYALLLTLPEVPGVGRSELLPDRNFALYVDRLLLGRFDDGLQYTWLLSGLGFTATTLSGLFAGELIRSDLPRGRVARYLALAGLALLVAGVVLGIWHPIVKKIWTSTFVLASSGVCFLLLALFYYVIDVRGWTGWTFWLKVIGMNAIVAYVASHMIDFPGIAGQLMFGLEPYLGAVYPAATVVGGFGLLYLILWYMYRNGTYVRV